LITDHQLRSAASAIGAMPASEVDRRLRQLSERRESRADLTELRQLAEPDLAELEQASYHLARKYQDDGDLVAAARWYQLAAAHDFADAGFELAKVLDRLADGHRGAPASRSSSREELDLVSEAARWYGAAYAAGHPEAAELLDALIARHDPSRPRALHRTGHLHVQALPSTQGCSLGGLAEVMQCQLTAATAHIGTCRPCQHELLDHGGIVPSTGRHIIRDR
jgi:TPR repeat protein